MSLSDTTDPVHHSSPDVALSDPGAVPTLLNETLHPLATLLDSRPQRLMMVDDVRGRGMMHTRRTLFCQGCNEKFAVAGDQTACPHCGQTLATFTDAPTQAFDDIDARGTCLPATDVREDAADELVGRRIGTYAIDSFLGKGGMARVYRATHTTLERPCAVKVLHPDLVARNGDYVNAFLAEARAAASLVHPHVVTIHTIGSDQGLHFIEMEFVAGRSLQRLVDSGHPLDPTLVASLMVQMCAALAEAHRVGMVHRDIKPSNALVTADWVAKLSDFGLAKRVVGADLGAAQQSLVGTPYYMAPELFAGRHADKRTDVYAMGVTFYHLLTAQLPFVDRSVVNLAQRHRNDPAPDVSLLRPDAPADAARIVARCLAKDPADRFADAAELLADLKALYGCVRDLESLLAEALAGLDLSWRRERDQIVVSVARAGGEPRRVVVEATSGGPIADRIVKIYSVCGPAREDYFGRALELNALLPHSSIAIERIDGRPQFVMANTYPRATCDPEEIRHSLLAIARHADEVERSLAR
jgi:serine/threonine-protein kinase